ncbi:MAG: OmpA family protein [Candidatus Poribacteria bacterium]|nr:OmpA family protein [Candidatus Poribacteria bacterium]
MAFNRFMQMDITWFFWVLAISTLTGCAGKVDTILLESALGDAQRAISEARRLGAEEHAGESLAKAAKLFEGARQAQHTGNGIQSVELSFRAQMEGELAGATARQRIAQKRIDEALAETLNAIIQEMEYEIQTAQVRQAIAEEQAKRALSRATRAEQQAAIAQAEAAEARNDAQHALFRSQTQLAIAKVQLILDAAGETGALTYAADDYQAAENLITQARSLLAQEQFDQAKSVVAQAEGHANKAKIAATAGANAAASEAQTTERQAYTNAKIAITRAQLEMDRAESVYAFEHAETAFQRAQTAIEQANMALKTAKYDQAVRLAAQAESSARDAYDTAEIVERERRAKEALEEQIAQAKDVIFKLEEGLNREGSAMASALSPEGYEQAKALFAEAKQALTSENYARAITVGRQSLEYLTAATEKAEQIDAVETQILNAAKAIPGAKTERTEKGLSIRLSGALFQQGSSQINPKLFPTIGQLAEVIKTFPDYNVRIEGHSDSIGAADANLKLTEKRANGFMKYLTEKCSVPVERMTAVGLGEKYPIADNRFKAGRDQNRRIDTIILTRETRTK